MLHSYSCLNAYSFYVYVTGTATAHILRYSNYSL